MIELSLPSSTVFNHRIPKQKFYENLDIDSDIKRLFIDQIHTITWQHKIAPSTVNVAEGAAVTEIEIFSIQLNRRELDIRILRLIDAGIPYHILFILEYGGEAQAWIAYKEQTQTNSGRFKAGTYYHTGWMPPEDLTLRLEGLTMDTIYDSLIRQIAGERLASGPDEDIGKAVSRDERRRKLEREIAILEKKVRAEKQFNRQVELYGELGKLKREMEGG